MPGRIAAYIGTAIFALVAFVVRVEWLRSFLTKRLPQPGDMPPRNKTEGGKWTALVRGRSDEPAGQKPVEVTAVIKVPSDFLLQLQCYKRSCVFGS